MPAVVAPSLFALPDELLEIAFNALLPELRSPGLHQTYVLDTPHDLLAVRLVSRRLHRLATPLAWRRVQLRLSAQSHHHSTSTSTKPTACCSSSSSPSASSSLQFFQTFPHLAPHVRLLLLLTVQGCPPPPQCDCRTTSARTALRGATQHMSALRAVLVWDSADILDARALREDVLARRPFLRTVCFMDLGTRLAGSLLLLDEQQGAATEGNEEGEGDDEGTTSRAFLQVRGGSCVGNGKGKGRGLKMLHVSNSSCPAAHVVRSVGSHGLECLSLEMTRRGGDSGGGAWDDGRDQWDDHDEQIDKPPNQKMLQQQQLLQPHQVWPWQKLQLQQQRQRQGRQLPRRRPTLRDLPWETLKELAVVDCDDDEWRCFLEGYKLYKSLALNTTMTLTTTIMPLTELLLGNLSGLPAAHLISLLQTFVACPHPTLRRLTLYHIPTYARLLPTPTGTPTPPCTPIPIPMPAPMLLGGSTTISSSVLSGENNNKKPSPRLGAARQHHQHHLFPPQTPLTPVTLLPILQRAFPSLTHLTLLTDSELLPWPAAPTICSSNNNNNRSNRSNSPSSIALGGMHINGGSVGGCSLNLNTATPTQTYVRLLMQFKHLRVLKWNNIGSVPLDESVEKVFTRLGSEESLRRVYDGVAREVARWVEVYACAPHAYEEEEGYAETEEKRGKEEKREKEKVQVQGGGGAAAGAAAAWAKARARLKKKEEACKLRKIGFVSMNDGIVDWVYLGRGKDRDRAQKKQRQRRPRPRDDDRDDDDDDNVDDDASGSGSGSFSTATTTATATATSGEATTTASAPTPASSSFSLSGLADTMRAQELRVVGVRRCMEAVPATRSWSVESEALEDV